MCRMGCEKPFNMGWYFLINNIISTYLFHTSLGAEIIFPYYIGEPLF